MTRSPSTAKPSSVRCRCSLGLVIALLFITIQQCTATYHGKLIGKLSQLHHGVSGEVYAVDARTLFIKDFTYDGEGPAAFFYAGTSKTLNNNGFKVRDEHGTTNVLKRYRKKDITLTLPEGKTLNNVKWFSVYCDEFAVNFGDVKIPRNFDYPRPHKLASLSGIHGVSSEPVVVVDAQTLLIPNFSYDGEAPDAKFWVGTGPSPSPQGIRVPDENGKEVPLRRYDHKTIVLTLPGDLTIHQLGHFGIWCEAFAVDFGHVQIPQQNINVPPSLKMLGVSPQSKLNCEILEDELAFEVRWAVAGDSIVVQLVGKLEPDQYMSFGVSSDPNKSIMVGGDVVVAWVDKQTLQGYAIDYILDSKSQCSGGRGSCPDRKIQENTNSVRLLNAAMVNGYSIVTYQRPLKASDELDQQILTNGSQAIIWAVGPLNDKNEVSFHSNYLKSDRFIEFGRPPAWNCPMPELHDEQQSNKQQIQQLPLDKTQYQDQESTGRVQVTTRRPLRIPATPASASRDEPWEIPPIQCFEPEDGVFYAQMGPTGGKHGYPAITGHVGWGISWYINGLLIPEIHVVRGKKYTFVVEGGENEATPARYHPFYITDDSVGGYQHKTSEERANVTIFAGVRRQRGVVRPTGVGRLCNWMPDQNQPPADEYASFGAYQRTLTLVCDHGEPGIVSWTPDENTPDTVYYQCFTHRYLGWKIHVHDTCDSQQSSASEQHEILINPNSDERQQIMDLETGASIKANPTKVTPSSELFQRHQEFDSQDFNILQNQAMHPQLHHHFHHPQSATNNFDHLITGPYLRDNQLYHHNIYNYNRNIPQLTYVPSQIFNFEYLEDEHRSPTKLAYGTEKYIIQRDNNNNYYYHLHQPHHDKQPSMTYEVHEPNTDENESQNSKLNPNSQFSEIVADHHQIVRRPSAVLNQMVGIPMHVSYSIPMYEPTTPSQKVMYTQPQLQTVKLHSPEPLQMMTIQKKLQSPPSTYFRTAVKRPDSMISSITSYKDPKVIDSNSVIPIIKSPIFYEQKKTIHRTPIHSRIYSFGKIPLHQEYYYHPTKLTKIHVKQIQKPKTKTKITPTVIHSSNDKVNLLRPTITKSTRNTGFDPKSIVIEKGFKPILNRSFKNKNNNFDENLEKIQDQVIKESTLYGPNDNFEPVFMPSPQDLNNLKKRTNKKIQFTESKLKLDNTNDIETAVTDKELLHYTFLYLPTITSVTTRNKSNDRNINTNLQLELKKIEPVKKTNSTFLKNKSEIYESSLDSRVLLTKRKKRLAQNQTKKKTSQDIMYQNNHDLHDNQQDTNYQDNYRNDHKQITNNLPQTNTGKIILANIKYITLTIFLYCII